MNYTEARDKFITTWGGLGPTWGINKTMAQIHALLFIETTPLSMENIMNTLKISRGNTSMNLRLLIDWGIVYKSTITGDRRDYYYTIKDTEELIKIIAIQRSKRELKPAIKLLEEISNTKSDNTTKTTELKRQTQALLETTKQIDNSLNTFINNKNNWVKKSIIKMFQ